MQLETPLPHARVTQVSPDGSGSTVRAAAGEAAADKATRGMADLAVATKVFDLFILTPTPSTIAL